MERYSDILIERFGTTDLYTAVHTPGIFVEIDNVTREIVAQYAVSFDENVMDIKTGTILTKTFMSSLTISGDFTYVIIVKL